MGKVLHPPLQSRSTPWERPGTPPRRCAASDPPVPAQVRQSASGFAACLVEQVALDLEPFWLAAEPDSLTLQNGHQRVSELLLVLPRLPHLADAKVAVRAETDVRDQPCRRPGTRLLQLLAGAVVLRRRHAARRKPNELRHSREPACRGPRDSTRIPARRIPGSPHDSQGSRISSRGNRRYVKPPENANPGILSSASRGL